MSNPFLRFLERGSPWRAAAYDHPHSIPWSQRHALHRFDDMAGQKLEAKRAEQVREHDDGLLQREAHAYADARTRAERNVGIAVDRIAVGAEKALGIERIGVLP